jgi:thiosulfate reductase cytochrome b subunit
MAQPSPVQDYRILEIVPADGPKPDIGSQDRHSLVVRLTHWVNALCFGFLLFSGGAILFAVPAFYIGQTGYEGMAPLFRLPIAHDTHFQTWDRQMHFAFAWLLLANAAVYLAHGLVSRHLTRDLAPRRAHLSPGHLWAEARGHLDLRHFWRPAEPDYNALQRLTYLAVIFGAGPLMVLTGLTMAPAVAAWAPWLETLFHGRQTARLVHFVGAGVLVLFILVHLSQVIATGPVNQIRAMITGRYRLARKAPAE